MMSDGASEKRLASTGRAVEEDALGLSNTERVEEFRMLCDALYDSYIAG